MTEQVHNLNEGPGEQSFSWLFQVLNALLGFCSLIDKLLLLSFLAEASDSGEGNVTADCIPIEFWLFECLKGTHGSMYEVLMTVYCCQFTN